MRQRRTLYNNRVNYNIHASNIRAPKYMKQTWTELKGEIHSKTIIVDFNTPHLFMARVTRRKKIEELNNTIDQLNPTDVYRTLKPTVEYIFF